MRSVDIPSYDHDSLVQAGSGSARARRVHWLSPGLSFVYKMGIAAGSNQLMRLAMRLILKLEAGEMHSGTARRLLKLHHEIDVGDFSYGCFDPIRFPSGVLVGNFTSIARSVKSYRKNHDARKFSTHPLLCGTVCDEKALVIEHDVWIGAQTIILPGCQRIGTGAVVGAGSVLTRNVDPYTVVAGNPARVIKDRFDEQQTADLLRSRWWELPLADADRESRLFNKRVDDRTKR